MQHFLAGKKAQDNKDTPSIKLPAGHKWECAKKLGSGGQGTAYLWMLLDSKSQKIVDRIVIKNMYVKPASSILLQKGPGKVQLKKVYFARLLAPDGSTDRCTVPVTAIEQIPGVEHGWRTYAPFFSLGDLTHLISAQKSQPFPEAFIWYLFHRLAKATIAMDEALQDEPGKPAVVHLDIKAANVFVDSPGSLGKHADFVMYPPAYLGDFGCSEAISFSATDPPPVVGVGTKGFMPPEVWPLTEITGSKAVLDAPATSATNIWQIGYVVLFAMEMLVNSFYPRPQIKWEKGEDSEPHYDQMARHEKLIKAGWAGYSKDLVSTVEQCLRYQPHKRPTPSKLLATVEAHMANHTDGMDRWGTVDWFNEQEKRSSGVASGSKIDRAGDTESARSSRKRVAASPLISERTKAARMEEKDKEERDQDVEIRKRARLVARQMREGKKSKLDFAIEDADFVLADQYKIVHPPGSMLDIESYFTRAEPGPIEYLALGAHAGPSAKPTKAGGLFVVLSDKPPTTVTSKTAVPGAEPEDKSATTELSSEKTPRARSRPASSTPTPRSSAGTSPITKATTPRPDYGPSSARPGGSDSRKC